MSDTNQQDQHRPTIIIPEESAELQAIESREEKEIDANPDPYTPLDRPKPKAAKVKPVLIQQPKKAAPLQPAPEKPKTLAERIADELAHAPATDWRKYFRPFADYRRPYKVLFIAIAVVVLFAVIAAYLLVLHA